MRWGRMTGTVVANRPDADFAALGKVLPLTGSRQAARLPHCSTMCRRIALWRRSEVGWADELGVLHLWRRLSARMGAGRARLTIACEQHLTVGTEGVTRAEPVCKLFKQ